MWIDAHCHTKYSYDNWLEPVDLIRRAKELGLDGVCITEHYSYEASAPVEKVGRDEGLLVLRGVEIATDRGHMLAYGVEDDGWNIWGRNNYLPLQAVIEHINSIGGICVPAHPFREVGVSSLLHGLLDITGIAAVETHNGGNLDSDNDLAISAARHMALPALGGSDCHKTVALGRCATKFSQPVTDMASFIAAVCAGACQGSYYPGYVQLTQAA
ncbi:CehA/McbA family metallohydrolase [Aromatoleum aromaticum]|uniref:CehA/McbA family metallohydrolase n=1 Tax=Aromatoleum aromaticum TaxID=551760 RepID=UPI001459D99A|nr:PHP domain-containing protein [Aromatoleum aromaticum]NMG55180.1 PHP domain-containing protein [Aromatoleum aromaticum]